MAADMKRSKTRQRRLEQRLPNSQPVLAPPPAPVDLPDSPKPEDRGPPVGSTAFARRDLFLYVLVVPILFLATCWNVFHTCEHVWFSTFLLGDEHLVIDSMIRHRATSRIPAPVGLGTYGLGEESDYPVLAADFRASKQPAGPFYVYRSHTGAQCYLFVLLDTLFHPNDVDPFHALNSLLAAAVLGALVVWARAEFGWAVAVSLLVAMVLSRWLIVFGRNLYWMSWTWWLPMIAVSVVFNRYRHGTRRFYTILFLSTGLLVFMKCSAGYEFTPTILIAAATPALYYGLKVGRRWKSIVGDIVGIGCAGAAGFLAAVFLHALLLGPSLSGGFASIWSDARRRTYGSPSDFGPEFRQSLEVSPLVVVNEYLWKDHETNAPFGIVSTPATGGHVSPFVRYQSRLTSSLSRDLAAITYGRFLLLFAASGLAAPCLWRTTIWDRSLGALLAAAAFSVAAPISWFVLAKGHSWIHTHINFVLWHVPFVNLAVVFMAVLLFRTAARVVGVMRAATIGVAHTSPWWWTRKPQAPQTRGLSRKRTPYVRRFQSRKR
jgi:hypothetical protein